MQNTKKRKIRKEEEEIIRKVAKRFRAFTFGYFESDDIEQEAYIIGIKAYQKWDRVRPLENFLCVSIRNKLCTLRRDRYHRSGGDETKKSIVDALDISKVNEDKEKSMQTDESMDFIMRDMLEYIDKRLPIDLRVDYLKMREGARISPKRRKIVEDKIKEIIRE